MCGRRKAAVKPVERRDADRGRDHLHGVFREDEGGKQREVQLRRRALGGGARGGGECSRAARGSVASVVRRRECAAAGRQSSRVKPRFARI